MCSSVIVSHPNVGMASTAHSASSLSVLVEGTEGLLCYECDLGSQHQN